MIAIYARTSTDNERKVSIDNQVEKGKEFAAKLSLTYLIFIDRGLSGGKVDRIQYEEMINSIDSKGITHLWFYDQSRAWRETEQASKLWFYCKRNNITICLGDRTLDYDNQADFIFWTITAVQDESWRLNTGKKVAASYQLRIPRGGKGGGVSPFGYRTRLDKKLEIHPEEAKIVKEIFELNLKGKSTLNIAQHLNDRKFANRNGKRWWNSSVFRILKRKTYFGLYIINEGKPNEVSHFNEDIAIISKETYNKAQENLGLNNLKRDAKKHPTALLKGIIKCGICERNMSHEYRGLPDYKEDYPKLSHYYCSAKKITGGCSGKNIKSLFIDKYVWKLFSTDGVIQQILLKASQSNNLNIELSRIEEELMVLKDNRQKVDSKIELLIEQRLNSQVEENFSQYISEDRAASLIKKFETEINRLTKEIERLQREKNDKQNLLSSTESLRSDITIITDGIPREEKREYIWRYIKEIFVGFNEDTKRFILLFNFNHSRESFAVSFKKNYTDIKPLFNQEGELIGNENVLKYLKRGRSMFVSSKLDINIEDYKPV